MSKKLPLLHGARPNFVAPTEDAGEIYPTHSLCTFKKLTIRNIKSRDVCCVIAIEDYVKCHVVLLVGVRHTAVAIITINHRQVMIIHLRSSN
jgi:hypothetical protein